MVRNIQAALSTASPIPDDADGFEMPPFPRYPKNGMREATESIVQRIVTKVEQLKGLDQRVHPCMLEYRQVLLGQLESNGPYRLRISSGVF